MKLLLIAINAKYIHSNLAVYSLKAYAGPEDERIEIAEYTINQPREEILADIYRRKPDVAAFSCYLWNMEYTGALIPEVSQVLPEARIWVGGPEVSYDAASFLEKFPQVELVMNGEGEDTFRELALMSFAEENEGSSLARSCAFPSAMRQGSGERQGAAARALPDVALRACPLADIAGITWRGPDGAVHANPPRALLPMDALPFPYRNLDLFENRILYYESSRGCPFSCSYCMSSIDKTMRFRSLPLVKKELTFFLDRRVPQVKFVDRTFNCSHGRTVEIWSWLKKHDNGVTNFHFEISADLLNEEEIALLNTLRPGLVQLEIGIQSTNPRTLEAISRKAEFSKIARAVRGVRQGNNVHQHLDLIAGLPYENLESFRKSFNDVYALKPQQLQLGFLKVLKGSGMHGMAESFGIVYRARPPYEVLKTDWISYGELLELKAVEEMVEVYYNSSQFSHTIAYLEPLFPDAFTLYKSLGEFCRQKGYEGKSHSRLGRLNILREFALETPGCSRAACEDRLLYDLYLRENSKSRPEWAPDLTSVKDEVYAFYKEEEKEHRFLDYGEHWKARQLMHMTHMERFSDGTWMLFDYRNRNPLNGDAATYCVQLNGSGKTSRTASGGDGQSIQAAYAGAAPGQNVQITPPKPAGPEECRAV